MAQNPESISLTDVERRIHISSHQDGLLEFTFGLLMIAAGLLIEVEASIGMLPLVVLVVPLLRLVRVKVVMPRVGQVRWRASTKRHSWMRKITIVTVAVAILLVAFVVNGSGASDWFFRWLDVLILGLIAVQFFFWGAMLPLAPFLAAGTALSLVIAARAIFTFSSEYSWIIGGAALAVLGGARFYVFLHNNPAMVPEEVSDDN
jgi:hypothetical protein